MCISQKKELMIMRYTITGRNIEVTPGLKAAVEKKIGKLEHFSWHRSDRSAQRSERPTENRGDHSS